MPKQSYLVPSNKVNLSFRVSYCEIQWCHAKTSSLHLRSPDSRHYEKIKSLQSETNNY